MIYLLGGSGYVGSAYQALLARKGLAFRNVRRADFEAYKAKANKEAEKHRLRAKEAEAKFEGLQKSLAGALGVKATEDGSTGAPSLEVVTKAAEAKQRNLLLRSEFVALAAQEGAADPRDAFHHETGCLG